MKFSSIFVMSLFASLSVFLAFTATVSAEGPAPDKTADEVSGDSVVVMYFHRTQRCPTCQKMGTYTEEAVKDGFANQLKEKKVSLHYVNFEDSKNTALTKAYGVSGPTLIVALAKDGKAVRYRNLKDIWSKATEKPQFILYVQENVKSYLDQTGAM